MVFVVCKTRRDACSVKVFYETESSIFSKLYVIIYNNKSKTVSIISVAVKLSGNIFLILIKCN